MAERDRTTRLQEQIEHYEADAGAYQRWLDHLADETNLAPVARAARARRERLAGLVASMTPLGRVLELAAGTGRLSTLIAPHAARLVLVDSSPTSLVLARDRLVGCRCPVELVQADLFAWQPDEAFDTVAFAGWLHHVPLDRFAGFWSTVGASLAPGGRVVFEFAAARSARTDDVPPVPAQGYGVYHQPARNESVRDLEGRRWTVVHQLWDPERLADALRPLGWRMEVVLAEDDGFDWAVADRL